MISEEATTPLHDNRNCRIMITLRRECDGDTAAEFLPGTSLVETKAVGTEHLVYSRP